jgi:hypothetical protein
MAECNDLDDRHERIDTLLYIMGDYNNLAEELTAEPPCYSEIISCVDALSQTLKDAKEHLIQIKEEVDGCENSNSHTGSDPA